jgi:hypothetical protein
VAGGRGVWLLVVTPMGVEVNGQKAWLRLPVVGQFQPSEFVKIPTVLMLAKYFGNKKGGALTLREVLIGGAIFAGPIVLIMLEPDAGQAITYFPILAAMFFLSGIKIRYVVLPRAWRSCFRCGARRENGKDQTLPTGAILAIIDPDESILRYGITRSNRPLPWAGGLSGSGDPETSQSVSNFCPSRIRILFL